jgi:hypothetical protein
MESSYDNALNGEIDYKMYPMCLWWFIFDGHFLGFRRKEAALMEKLSVETVSGVGLMDEGQFSKSR